MPLGLFNEVHNAFALGFIHAAPASYFKTSFKESKTG